MRSVRCLPLVLVALLAHSTPSAKPDAGNPQPTTAPSGGRVASRNMPLSFEVNRGQTSPEVKFLSRGDGYVLFLTGDQAVLEMRHAAAGDPRSGAASDTATAASVVRMKLQGAAPKAKVAGTQPLPGKSNYFLGNDPRKWRIHVPNYARVEYTNIYPGVDLVYYGTQGQLEYDFVVAPGASAERIALEFDGAQPTLAANGDLTLDIRGGDLRFHKPLIYQSKDGSRQAVDGSYIVTSNRVSFALGNYDHSRALVIDPLLVYSTYLGGTKLSEGDAMAIDSAGSVYVTGHTLSSDFPTKNPIEPYHTGGACAGGTCLDVFVTKFNATGTALVYSTFLGGMNDDYGFGIAVDSAKNAYVVGRTASNDFPVAGAMVHPVCGEILVMGVPTGTCDETHFDAFATKLNSSGSGIVYSSFIGGTADDWATGVAVDSAGEAYIVGQTQSQTPTGDVNNPGFPITPSTGFLTTLPAGGQIDTFFVKLNASGGGPLYGTFLGSTTVVANSPGAGIAVDKSGNAYVTGFTNAPDFPVTTGAFKTSCVPPPLRLGLCNGNQAFVSKLNPALSLKASLIYSTYLGGTTTAASDQGNAIAVDSAGSAYVTGLASSADFPTTTGAFQTSCVVFSGACTAAFVTKLNTTGTGLVYSTFLGDETPPNGKVGNAAQGFAIAVDGSKNAYVTGWVHEANPGNPSFPVVNPLQTPGVVFLSKLSPTGKALLFSTHFGGTATEQGSGIAVDAKASVYVAGFTLSHDFTTTLGAFQTSEAGPLSNPNAFAFKIATVAADLSLTNAAPGTITSGSNLSYVIDTTNTGPDTAASVVMSDTVPAGTTFVSVTTNVGSCTAPPVGGVGKVMCKVSSLANAASLDVTLTVKVTATSGAINDTASVTSAAFDINTKNNAAKVSTTVH